MSFRPGGPGRWTGIGVGAFAAAGFISSALILGHVRPPGYSHAQENILNNAGGPVPASAFNTGPQSSPFKDPKDLHACQSFYHWTCGNLRTIHDPTGFVLKDVEAELSSLRIYEDLIRKHPDETSDQIDERLAQSVYSPKRIERLSGVFHWVKAQMLNWVLSLPESKISIGTKGQLADRIEKTRLDLPSKLGKGYEDEPDLLTKSGAFYERTLEGDRFIRLGGAYVQGTTSLFNLTYTLGHELAHSIDPCELEETGLANNAFRSVEECFVRKKIIPQLKAKARCSAGDLLSEAFADWVAAELVTRRLKEFAAEFDAEQLQASVMNSVRDLCHQGEALGEMDTSFHPKPEVRIEALFGQHPTLREVLGCGPSTERPDTVTSGTAQGYCKL